MKNAPAAPLRPSPGLRATLSLGRGAGGEPFRNGMEFAPVGALGGAFLAMAVPVRDPSSVDRAVLNREMGCNAVGQVFQNAIAAVWIPQSRLYG